MRDIFSSYRFSDADTAVMDRPSDYEHEVGIDEENNIHVFAELARPLSPTDIKPAKIGSKNLKFSWIQVLREGRWKHPVYGLVDVNQDTFAQLKEHYEQNVRGIDIAIDTEHKEDKGAVGWVKKLESRPTGLWAFVEWTSKGLSLIKDKVYRYVSAEFSPKYEDPETGQSTSNVLVAVTLTNRPFIKRMAPILLAESGLKTCMLNEWELAQYEANLIEPESFGQQTRRFGGNYSKEGDVSANRDMVKSLKLKNKKGGNRMGNRTVEMSAGDLDSGIIFDEGEFGAMLAEPEEDNYEFSRAEDIMERARKQAERAANPQKTGKTDYIGNIKDAFDKLTPGQKLAAQIGGGTVLAAPAVYYGQKAIRGHLAKKKAAKAAALAAAAQNVAASEGLYDEEGNQLFYDDQSGLFFNEYGEAFEYQEDDDYGYDGDMEFSEGALPVADTAARNTIMQLSEQVQNLQLREQQLQEALKFEAVEGLVSNWIEDERGIGRIHPQQAGLVTQIFMEAPDAVAAKVRALLDTLPGAIQYGEQGVTDATGGLNERDLQTRARQLYAAAQKQGDTTFKFKDALTQAYIELSE